MLQIFLIRSILREVETVNLSFHIHSSMSLENQWRYDHHVKLSLTQKLSNKSPVNKAIKAAQIAVRGTLWYRQMVKDVRINQVGGVYQQTGESFGPQPVFWHGLEQKNGGAFKVIPPFKVE